MVHKINVCSKQKWKRFYLQTCPTKKCLLSQLYCTNSNWSKQKKRSKNINTYRTCSSNWQCLEEAISFKTLCRVKHFISGQQLGVFYSKFAFRSSWWVSVLKWRPLAVDTRVQSQRRRKWEASPVVTSATGRERGRVEADVGLSVDRAVRVRLRKRRTFPESEGEEEEHWWVQWLQYFFFHEWQIISFTCNTG